MIEYDKVGSWYRVVKKFKKQTNIFPRSDINLLFCSLSKEGVVTLKPGYCSDGVTYWWDRKKAITPAFVHDFFADLYQKGLITKEHRKLADKQFRIDLEQAKINKISATLMYGAVRRFFEAFH